MASLAIKVENIKCGGCASSIEKALLAISGIETVVVDIEEQEVRCEGKNPEVQRAEIVEALRSLGYPEQGTAEGFEGLVAGAKSYVSCAIGRMSKPTTADAQIKKH